MTEKISRRGFMNWLTAGGIIGLMASVFYPVVRFLFPPKSGEANVSQVKLPFSRSDIEADPSKAKTFKFGRDLGIIALTGEGKLRAMAATCTHLDCTVQHRPDLGIIWCSCHNGRYDLEGKNLSGPPPRPLEQFVVTETDDEIMISKEDA